MYVNKQCFKIEFDVGMLEKYYIVNLSKILVALMFNNCNIKSFTISHPRYIFQPLGVEGNLAIVAVQCTTANVVVGQ